MEKRYRVKSGDGHVDFGHATDAANVYRFGFPDDARPSLGAVVERLEKTGTASSVDGSREVFPILVDGLQVYRLVPLTRTDLAPHGVGPDLIQR